jgi:hypothetical protein
MARVRTTLFILFVTATLVVGCQTAPSRTTGDSGSARPAPAAPIPTPAMEEVAKACADPSAHEGHTELPAAPISTIELQRDLTELYASTPTAISSGTRNLVLNAAPTAAEGL